MLTTTKPRSSLYPVLGIVLAFLALNAFGGGYYGMAGAKDVPVSWLEGSPFKDYMIPSIFLFAVIGGLASLSSILVFKKSRLAIIASFITGVVVLLWILAQLMYIGYASWMQPFTALMALAILTMSVLLKESPLK